MDSRYNLSSFKKYWEAAISENYPIDFRPTKNDSTILYIALKTKRSLFYNNQKDYIEVAKELIRSGADVNIRTRMGNNALSLALMYNPEPELIRMILEKTEDINTDTIYINKVPYDTDVMKIALGNCLSARNADEYANYIECIKLLLEYGYDYQKMQPLKEYAYNITEFMVSYDYTANEDRFERTLGIINNYIIHNEEREKQSNISMDFSYEL